MLVSLRSSHGDTVATDDFTASTAIAAQALQQWYNPQGLWDGTGWWNAANCLEAIENAMVANNGGVYLEVLQKTFDRNSRKNFLNEFYDDEGWWALAWMRAYDLTGEARYLEMAKTIFADMQGGWDDHCDGGIWWKKERRYKNAIANELFLLVAVRLHQRTVGSGESTPYLDWALKEWRWFQHSGMINPNHLVNDGLNHACENNGRTTWTYNQGVLVGGLTELFRVTGDTNYLHQAVLIADASIATLVDPNGVLSEPAEREHGGGRDVPQFKGIFIRYLALLYDATRQPEYFGFLSRNAHSVWFNNRDASNQFGLRWSGPVDAVDAARHSSAMMAVSALAEPVTTIAPSAFASWTAANLTHDLGRPTGLSAWAANPIECKASGYLVKGARTETLRPGQYIAAFELKVDNFNRDDSKVVTLSVVEAGADKVVTTRTVTRKEFTTTLYQTFPLHFQASANKLYEFRTFWHYAPHAARLTHRSLVLQIQ
jgi:predicted alpha-1,6-mannanase (GH76 family)